MWTVQLIKKPKQDDFRVDFFPRKIRYKRDAENLCEEIASKGGKAIIKKG